MVQLGITKKKGGVPCRKGGRPGGNQKLESRVYVWSVLSNPTPDLKYSLTPFSKKLVFALEANCLHPFERVVGVVVSVAAKF